MSLILVRKTGAYWFEVMAIMGKSTLQQRDGSMHLGPSLPGMAQCHFIGVCFGIEEKPCSINILKWSRARYMDIPYTPSVLQTQTHGVLCTERALQLQPAQGCQGPLVTQQSIGSGPWQSRNTIITTKQTKYRYMCKVQVATNSMVAWCSQVTQQSNGSGSLANQRKIKL